MTGTKLVFLDGPVYVGRRRGVLNLARAVADDDCDDIRLESSGRFQDMKKESFSAQRMKHFRKVRLHSGSLTGGKQDYSELVHRCVGEIDYSGSLKAINDRLLTDEGKLLASVNCGRRRFLSPQHADKMEDRKLFKLLSR